MTECQFEGEREERVHRARRAAIKAQERAVQEQQFALLRAARSVLEHGEASPISVSC